MWPFKSKKKKDDHFSNRKDIMLPYEAESIVYEFGECLEKKLVVNPQNLNKRISNITRNDLRIAVMLFVAKKKYEGDDILYRHKLKNGQRVATLELVDKIWNYIPLFVYIKQI